MGVVLTTFDVTWSYRRSKMAAEQLLSRCHVILDPTFMTHSLAWKIMHFSLCFHAHFFQNLCYLMLFCDNMANLQKISWLVSPMTKIFLFVLQVFHTHIHPGMHTMMQITHTQNAPKHTHRSYLDLFCRWTLLKHGSLQPSTPPQLKVGSSLWRHSHIPIRGNTRDLHYYGNTDTLITMTTQSEETPQYMMIESWITSNTRELQVTAATATRDIFNPGVTINQSQETSTTHSSRSANHKTYSTQGSRSVNHMHSAHRWSVWNGQYSQQEMRRESENLHPSQRVMTLEIT